MHFYKRLGQRQAKAGTFKFAAECGVDLAEPRQGLWNVVRRDADSGIDNLEHEAPVRVAPGLEQDLTAGPREFDPVPQQVGQNLFQLATIGAGGALRGYSGGLGRKRWLLQHEGVMLPRTRSPWHE